MAAPLTATMITQLNNANMANQRAGAGTLLGRLAPAGDVFYVDGNYGDDSNDGSSWASAFATLTVALAASDASIGAGAFGWTSRNIIYLKDDENTEDLELLADKTDVIGVGSWDRWKQPKIEGNHVVTTQYDGCRFINCHFKDGDDGGDIFTAGSYVSGLSFIGCTFEGVEGPATAAIVATKPASLTIQDCKFIGDFSDAAIEINGTGGANDLFIADNFIQGANDGVEIKSTITTAAHPGYIIRNNIATTEICINDASSKMYVHDNFCITGNAKGSDGAGAIVAGSCMMLGNKVSCSDVANADVPALGSLA